MIINKSKLIKLLLDNRGLIEDLSINNQKKAKTFNIDSYCNNLHSIFTEQINKNNFYESMKDKNKEKLNKFLDKFKIIKANDLKKIRRHINLSNQSVPNHRLVNIMHHAGYEQIIKKDEVVYAKRLDK